MKTIFRKIIGPRPWRRLLFAFLWLITLFALFHAIENYRGRKAWSQWQAKLAALGESTKFEDHIPKEIPAAQNFAATPFIESWFDSSTSVDWGDDFVKAKKPSRQNKPEDSLLAPIDLPAWASSLRDLNENASNNNREENIPAYKAATEIIEFMKPAENKIHELKAASKRPLSRYPIDYSNDIPFGVLLPHLAYAKQTGIRLQVLAAAHLELSQTEEAYELVNLMFKFSQSLSSDPFLISLLVQMSLDSLLNEIIWQGRHKWSEEQLSELSRKLIARNYALGLYKAYQTERVGAAKTIEFIQKSGPHHLHAFIGNPGEPPKDIKFFQSLARLLIPRGWFDLEKVNLYKTHFEILLPSFDPTNSLFHPSRATPNEQQLENYFGKNQNNLTTLLEHKLFTTLLTPAFLKTTQKASRLQTESHLCATALALELHKRKTGSYPENLASLVPAYIPKLPHDPIGGQPLKYRKTEDTYILYSIGWNAKDDGGQPGKKFEELDFVW